MDAQETTVCENCKTGSGKPVQFYFAKKTSTTNDKSVKTISYDIALSQPVSICFECAKKGYQKQIPRAIQAALGALAIGALLFFFGPIISFDQLIIWQILGGIVMVVGFVLIAEGYDTFWTTLPRNLSRDS